VDFGTSNHMTNHGKWFRDTKDLETLRFVKIGDDTTHPSHKLARCHCPCKMSKQSI